MKKNGATTVLVLGLALMAGAVVLLRNIEQHRRIGEPGLTMIAENVFDEAGGIVNTNTVALPHQVLDYDSEPRPITSVELGWLPADTTYARRIYTATNAPPLQVNVVMMGRDRSSIHKPQICLTGQGWLITSENESSIVLPDRTQPLPVWRMVAEQTRNVNGRQQMVKAVYVYWFVADGYVTARHGQRMWWMAKNLLTTGTLQRWSYISVLGLCLPGEEEQMYDRIQQFISASTAGYHRFDDSTVFASVP